MAALNRLSRAVLVILLIAAGISGPGHAAEPIPFADDGWYSWRFASVHAFEEEYVYVLLQAGKATKIQLVGRWCDGSKWSRSTRNYPQSTDLGLLATDQSLDWFETYVGERTELSSDALAVVAQHDGPRALQILIDVVESDAPMDVREDAVFWMAQSGSEEAFAYLDRLLMLK